MSLLRFPCGKCRAQLFVCARWGAEREAVGRAVGAQLTPDTMVSLMLQSEQIWILIESFVTTGDEDDGARWKCRARQQWGPVEIASGPTPAVLRLGRTWLSASAGRVVRDFKLEPTAREV